MSTPSADNTLPLMTFPARIGWNVQFSSIIFAEPPYLVMHCTPQFPGCHGQIDKRGIVWDVFALVASAQTPGAHQVLTCDCGYAPDAGLEERIFVSHPDAETVVWELDIAGLRPALDEALVGDAQGFVRLVFAKSDYEADILAMVHEMQHLARNPVAVRELSSQVHDADHLKTNYPELQQIQVEELEPSVRDPGLERLLELQDGEVSTRQPVWPPGTLVEFGLFARGDGHELMRINGETLPLSWPGQFFPRWAVMDAFRLWLAPVRRAFGLRSTGQLPPSIRQNEFVLLRESDRDQFHEAGRRLVLALQACLDEGDTAPGVTVNYCACAIHALDPDG
jgi:hypothetical protein